jgi:putative Mg2+ transporter-C (MgtC) family protein
MMITDYIPFLQEPNIITLLVRTFVAIVCAGIIGYDRDTHGAPAGFRTHILVCLGAMIAMSTGQYAALYYTTDIQRIGAQVVSGIGFLGAGSIIVNKRHITGLTTAAGLWASACIGLAIGIGFYEGAIVGTAAVYFTESILRGISKNIKDKYSKDKEETVIDESQDKQ